MIFPSNNDPEPVIEVSRQYIQDMIRSDQWGNAQAVAEIIAEQSATDMIVLASIYGKLGNLPAVYETIMSAGKLWPDNDKPKIWMVRHLIDLTDYDIAFSLLESFASTPENEFIYYSLRAGILAQVMDRENALIDSNKALVAAPNAEAAAQTKIVQANILRQMGRDAEAIECYRTILRVNPFDPEAIDGLLFLLFKNQQYEDCIALARSVQKFPDQAATHQANVAVTEAIAFSLIALKRYDDAYIEYVSLVALVGKNDKAEVIRKTLSILSWQVESHRKKLEKLL
jgi:tetratricopeptide (TPR) repeat protein